MTDHRLDPEWAEPIYCVSVAAPHDIRHYDVSVGKQHHARVMTTPIVKHGDLGPVLTIIFGGRNPETRVMVEAQPPESLRPSLLQAATKSPFLARIKATS